MNGHWPFSLGCGKGSKCPKLVIGRTTRFDGVPARLEGARQATRVYRRNDLKLRRAEVPQPRRRGAEKLKPPSIQPGTVVVVAPRTPSRP